MRKAIIVAVVAVVIALPCLFLSTPALADYSENGVPVETRTSGTVNGGVFIGYEAWHGDISEGTTTLTGNFDVPDGEVEWARLYTGIWGGTEGNAGWAEVTFNGESGENGLGQINLQGENDINPNVWCSGCGKHWMYYDVTDLVEQGSTNTATTSKINGSIDGRVYGIVLVVVYEGRDDPKDIQYWINDGSDGLNTNHDEGTTDFEGGEVDIGRVADAKLTMVHLTAYEPPCSDCLQFNEHSLDTSMVDSNTFALNTWDVTDYVESEENNVWFSRGDDDYVSITNAILVVERGAEEESEDKPDLHATAIKPYHYEWMEEENLPKGEPWFNLTNYVNVTVENTGIGDAGSFEVKMYADDELIESEAVEGLSAGGSKDIKFEWRPVGEDPLSWTDTAEGAKLSYKDTSRTYALRVVVDESDEILEESEENNELTKEQKVVWNGYMADEPLERYAHGKVNGGIIYTTGDGQYRVIGSGAKKGAYKDLNYDLAVPGSTTLARLYIYYTWAKPSYKAPKIGVTIETPSGEIHNLEMGKSYNDIKGDFGAFNYAWGTYAYDITDYVNESGTYVVCITNLNKGDDSDFATEFALAAPAILVVYEDTSEPKREYWINEGADVLIGGRRSDGGFLSLEECRNSALFTGNIDLNEVEKAVIGVVAPWGDSSEDNVLYFNNNELEKGGYCGYNSPCSEKISGISMNIGAGSAQVGIDTIDVTKYLKATQNTVIQGDDGDNMMPSNAFLVISYSSTPTITQTQTPTPAATPTATVNVTPTSTPTPTEENQTSEADEAPVPGFELAL
ncbi:hypothetical protein C5S30_06870, partial [ANME-1 cluster archaeon GoMg4]|nr:hypothetical protein [ANME-1 cluster archaeon GoMg4]